MTGTASPALYPPAPRSCRRADGIAKSAYTTRRRASSAKRVHGRRTGTKLRVYRCPSCAFYHLTSAPARDP